MIIDCHYHYFEEEFDPEVKFRDMEKAGIDKIAIMAPIAAQFKSEPNIFIMKFMRRLFGKPILMPLFKKLLCTFKGDGIDILGEQVPIYFSPQNQGVFEIAEKYPDKLYAWATVNPSNCSREALNAELRKWSEYKTFIGVKAHPFYHQYNAIQLDSVFSILNEMKMPIIIHMGFDDKEAILKLADKYQNVKIILAHCAFPYFNIMWSEIAKRNNIFVDISSSCYIDERVVRRAIQKLGVDKCIYGSDGPYGPPDKDGRFNLDYQVRNTMSWLDEKTKDRICYQNFKNCIKK